MSSPKQHLPKNYLRFFRMLLLIAIGTGPQILLPVYALAGVDDHCKLDNKVLTDGLTEYFPVIDCTNGFYVSHEGLTPLMNFQVKTWSDNFYYRDYFIPAVGQYDWGSLGTIATLNNQLTALEQRVTAVEGDSGSPEILGVLDPALVEQLLFAGFFIVFVCWFLGYAVSLMTKFFRQVQWV